MTASTQSSRTTAPNTRTWGDKDLIFAVSVNTTLCGVLRALGLSTSPGNYRTLHVHLKRLSLDTSHFTGKKHGTGGTPRRDLRDYLKPNSMVGNSRIKHRLVKEKLLEECCNKCGLAPQWQGEPLVLQLDHVNGDAYDNRLENLRLLCPNCHSQTTTFCKKRRYTAAPPNRCVKCTTPIGYRSRFCSKCAPSQRPQKIEWPPATILAREVIQTSYVKVAARLGVSGNAVKKYLKRELGQAPKKHKPK